MLRHYTAQVGLEQRGRARPLRCARRLLVVTCVALSGLAAVGTPAVVGATPPATPGTCRPLTPGNAAQGLPEPTGLATIAAAYTCVLTHYPAGNALDDRSLLHGALAGMVGYIARQGLDRANATLPAFSGDRTADWRAFARTYTAIAERLPQGAGVFQGQAIQQELAAAAVGGLVAGLNDDHAHYIPAVHLPGVAGKRIVRVPSGAQSPVPGGTPGPLQTAPSLGLHSSYPSHPTSAPVTPPLFIRAIDAGSPAERAGLRPGDVITAIDGAPPFSGTVANQGAIDLLTSGSPVQLAVQRPATGHTMTIHLACAVRKSRSASCRAMIINNSRTYGAYDRDVGSRSCQDL